MKDFLLVTLLLTTISCASYRGSGEFTKQENHFYTQEKIARQKGELYLPKVDGARPAVILVHGGGWRSRNLEDMNLIAKSLAEHGFIVFNINYRLAPEFKHPAPVEDLRQAHTYLLKLHEDKKIELDPNRVGLWGYSSGGHTISYYALQKNNPGPIKAVVSGGAPYDFTWYPLSPYLLDYMGKYRDEMIDAYIEASPVNHLHAEAPSFFLYNGIKDRLVEHAQASAFQFKLRQAGIQANRYDVAFWGHANVFIFSSEAVKQGVLFLENKL
jgi:acetyl esterase/lipase